MGDGIRAEVRIGDPTLCPVAGVSDRTETATYSISRGIDPRTHSRVSEEFVLDASAAGDSLDSADVDVSEVFSYGQKHVYRFSRRVGRGCPCECIEAFDCPVLDMHTNDGALCLAFHATDVEQLRDVIRDLKDRYSAVDVRRLLRTRGDSVDHDVVFVDRQDLTARQREVLRTAHEMGYFEHPKGANAGEVADRLDISTTTFTEHLSAAQRKVLAALMEA